MKKLTLLLSLLLVLAVGCKEEAIEEVPVIEEAVKEVTE